MWSWSDHQQQQRQGYAAANASSIPPPAPTPYRFIAQDVDDGATAISSFDYGTNTSEPPPLVVSL